MTEIAINDTGPHTSETKQQAFLRDLKAHGCDLVTKEDVVVLTRLAGRHKLFCELQCGTGDADQGQQVDIASTKRLELENDIRLLVDLIGATGAVFSSDPRGATVRLVLHDKYTDDIEHSGLCVVGLQIE